MLFIHDIVYKLLHDFAEFTFPLRFESLSPHDFYCAFHLKSMYMAVKLPVVTFVVVVYYYVTRFLGIFYSPFVTVCNSV